MPDRYRAWIDFDGTLVVPNVAILLVEQFGRDGRRVAQEVDEELHAGRITLRQAWEREVAILPADRLEEMAEYVRQHSPLRPGARRLVEILRSHRVPTTVVSGGVDFYIRPVLEREGIDWPVLSDTLTRPGPGTLGVAHPHGHATCRLCGICKAQIVLPEPGAVSVFVGDGSTDRYAAEVADVVFARHRLLAYCRSHGIACREYETLDPVADWFESSLRADRPPSAARGRGLSDSPCPVSQELARTAGAESLRPAE